MGSRGGVTDATLGLGYKSRSSIGVEELEAPKAANPRSWGAAAHLKTCLVKNGAAEDADKVGTGRLSDLKTKNGVVSHSINGPLRFSVSLYLGICKSTSCSIFPRPSQTAPFLPRMFSYRSVLTCLTPPTAPFLNDSLCTHAHMLMLCCVFN